VLFPLARLETPLCGGRHLVRTFAGRSVLLFCGLPFRTPLRVAQMLLNAPRAEVRQYILDEMNAIQKLRFPQTVAAREEAAQRRKRRPQQPQAPAAAPKFDRVEDLSDARRRRYDMQAAVYGTRCVLSCAFPYRMHFVTIFFRFFQYTSRVLSLSDCIF
jgi:hypothetical protein